MNNKGKNEEKKDEGSDERRERGKAKYREEAKQRRKHYTTEERIKEKPPNGNSICHPLTLWLETCGYT